MLLGPSPQSFLPIQLLSHPIVMGRPFFLPQHPFPQLLPLLSLLHLHHPFRTLLGIFHFLVSLLILFQTPLLSSFLVLLPILISCLPLCYIVGLGLNCKFIDLLFKRSFIKFIKISLYLNFIVLEIISKHTQLRTDSPETILIRNLLMVNHTVVIASVAACFHDVLHLISYQSPLTAMLKLL